MRKRKMLTKTFAAEDSKGKKYTIREYTEFMDASSSQNQDKGVSGVTALRVDGRGIVNRIEKGKYQMYNAFGPIDLFSDDPDAP